MALKLKGSNASPMRSLIDAIDSTISNRGQDFVSVDNTRQLVSMESLDSMSATGLQNRFDTVRQLIRSELQRGNALGLGMEDLAAADAGDAEAAARVETALDAGAMAAMAAGDPVAYAQAAYNGGVAAAPGVKIVDTLADGVAPAGMDYRPNVAMESFNDQELREHLASSVVFNIFASRQDDVAEMLFPTVVVPVDQAGLDMTVARMQVFNEVRHKASGAKIDFGKRNLIDAAVDHTILEGQSTRLVPVVLENGDNADKFVDDAIAGEYTIPVAGFEVPTAPLAVDKDIDLIGISQFAPLVGAGVIDHSDDVDARVVLESLVLWTGAGAGVQFPTARLARSAFNKTVEGNSRLVGLQFTSTDLVIDKDTKAIDGTDVTAFAAIVSNNLTVRLAVNVSGELNVEFGNIKVWAAKVGVETIQDANGVVISKTSGVGATVVSALAGLTVVGYTILANRTNANLRTRGHLLDTVYETQRYTIPLGSPLSITSPVASGGARDAADQKALIAAARTRNTNNAITALFATADQLRAAVRGPKHIDGTVSGVGGLGRFLIDPFFEEHELDLVASINSISSAEKAMDISAVLVNAIRDIAYRMYQQTKIQVAIDQMTGTAGQAPMLLIATDQVLIRHLMVAGDTRTFGTVFDKAMVKSSTDRRLRNKIVITMSVTGVEGAHPLTFGTHAWMSELIGLMPISRNGATTKEATVQPRTLHINNLPALAIIDVKGLTKVLIDKIETPKIAAAGAQNVYLDGLRQPYI